jgi:hypothetical protein
MQPSSRTRPLRNPPARRPLALAALIALPALALAGAAHAVPATPEPPKPAPVKPAEAAAAAPAGPVADGGGPPRLSKEEKAAGWQLLFDGKTTKGWRRFKGDKFPARGWLVKDGILVHEKNEPGFKAGDIVTTEEFESFELKLEARLTPRGNSGVKYLVNEALVTGEKAEKADGLGFEFQILDDDLHPDAKKGKNGNRTMGSLYDLIPPSAADKVVRPIGQWNEVRLVVNGNNVEHWLNGKKVLSYVRGSAELKALIAESKYKDKAGFGENARGHILLQDHNDEIAFRNIKLRKLPPARRAAR